MLAGILSGAGYYMGEHLIPPDEGNPKGYFEDDEVNAINESLLEPVTPERSQPAYGWRWLAAVPVGTRLPCSAALVRRIEAQTARAPYCFKDPRFCYTLPVWRPLLGDAVFLCVFREPARTAHSILKECQVADYLDGLALTFGEAIEVWVLMYRHILEVHRHSGDWLFFHYEQLFEEQALGQLEATLGAAANRGFADPKFRRSPAHGRLEPAVLEVYQQLCELARYRPRAAGVPSSGLAALGPGPGNAAKH
jgi:hypothetical protein